MFKSPDTQYAYCVFEGDSIIEIQKMSTEQDALMAGMIVATEQKYAIIAWMELETSNRLIWIIKDNVSSTEEGDMNLMMTIYEKLFSFDDDWLGEHL